MQIGNVSYLYLIAKRDRKIKAFLNACERVKQHPSLSNLEFAADIAKECDQAMQDIDNEVKRLIFVMDMVEVDGDLDKLEELTSELNSLQNEGVFAGIGLIQ